MATGKIVTNVETVKKYNFTSNGINFIAYKMGRICTLVATSGSTPELASGTTLVKLQAALRPIDNLNVIDTGTNARIMINNSGDIVINAKYPKGSYSRFYITYITAT